MISKVNAIDLNGNNGRLKKSQHMTSEHDKQFYHEFEEISSDVHNYSPSIIPSSYQSKYDIHRLITNGPRGMDPC